MGLRIKKISDALSFRLRCIMRGFGAAFNYCSMYLYAAAIGLIVGYDSLCFYFFFLLAVLSTMMDYAVWRRNNRHRG